MNIFPRYLHSSQGEINDFGVISLMYHRFEENKYPSTNIRIDDFKKHIQMIIDQNIKFISADELSVSLIEEKDKKKVLLTIDDGFLSFYDNAWPILKKREIPFILFVSTREVGNNGYMTWSQIREIAKEKFVHIGHHSHSHEYLIDEDLEDIKKDILTANKIFKKELGTVSNFFSYPFGEYSSDFKKLVKELNFTHAFGQHSGVIDDTKNVFELPRFPINEKYGKIDRFNTIIRTLPLKYEFIEPEEKYINDKTNPPKVTIKFAENYNLKLLNCFSNENDKWRQSKIDLVGDKTIKIDIKEKFITERGRINCSLRESNNSYRWLGIQFVIAEK